MSKEDLKYSSTIGMPKENPVKENDMVNHPNHYNNHPSGVECIDIIKHMGFCRGSAIKYIWRCFDKGKPIEDLKKAIFYLNTKIEMLEREVDDR